jgi:hypothetical protein
MADKIRFSSTMTKISSNIKKEDVYVFFTLKVVEDTSVRTFPSQFHTIDLGVFDSIANNDVFNKINIPADDYNLSYKIKFDELEFSAKLESINATVKHTKDGTAYTEYNLNFVKSLDKEIDTKLSYFLKLKEADEEGKKHIKWIDTTMTEDEGVI